jgi:hypothetical protein
MDPAKLWSSPAVQPQLKKQNVDWAKPSPEVQLILDRDGSLPPTYVELAALTQKEWRELQCTGVRSVLVGEGQTTNPPRDTSTSTSPQESKT